MSFATEGGHWYTQKGDPCYEVPNKSKGGMRNTTLRDAKTMGLVPSVTTVMNIVAKPGLEKWKRDQILMAALTLPKIDGESLDDFSKRVFQDAEEHARVARDDGTRIHGILEDYYVKGTAPSEHRALTTTVNDKLVEMFGEQEWLAEKSFAFEGFGGKVDLHSKDVVVDFKTTSFTENNKPRGWPEQVEQLAAYAYGLGLCNPQAGSYGFPRCANVYISTSVSNLIHVKEWTQDELYKGFKCFNATLDLWIAKKGYDPRS